MLLPTHEVVIVGNPENVDTVAMLDALRKSFLPSTVILFRSTADDGSEIVKLAPYTQYMKTTDGRATAYVCQDFVCKLPTTEVSEMMEMLRSEVKTPSKAQ